MNQSFFTDDMHRRKILIASIQGKLLSASTMIEAAINASSEARVAYTQGDNAAAAKNAEAIFAAAEEVMQSLNMVKLLSTKAGSDKLISPMPKFQNEIALHDNPDVTPDNAKPNK